MLRLRGLTAGEPRPRRRPRAALLALGAALLAGCAEREVVAAPAAPPGTGAWMAVWAAGALAAVVLGALLTLPCWTGPGPRRSRLPAAVLALQAGAAGVVTILLVGYALRSAQLVDRRLDEPAATALVRISRIDGDGSMFALIVLVVVALGALTVTVTTTAARMVALGDRLERWLAVALLGLEVLGASTLAVLHLIGFGGWPYRSGLVALPILVAAFATAWPRPAPPA